MILVSALLLSGCGLAEQVKTIKDDYLIPSIEAAREGGGNSDSSPDVVAHWDCLGDYEPFEEVGFRLENDALTVFRTGNYSRVVPFEAAVVGGVPVYGLSTPEGKVLLDGVLSGCESAVWYKSGRPQRMGVYIVSETAGDTRSYGLIASDGSWATDIKYSEIIPCSMGCVCVYDLEKNYAVCYGEDGSVVFDTANFASLHMVESGYIETMAAGSSDGWMPIKYTNGQFGFMNARGAILNRDAQIASMFDDALPFSEGLAAVLTGGIWGYISADGNWATGRLFSSVSQFRGGTATAVAGGSAVAINTSGEVICTFPAGAKAESVGGGCYRVDDGEKVTYCGADLAPVTIDGATAEYGGDGIFWAAEDGGIKIRDGSNYVFVSGAAKYRCTDGAGMYIVELADGTAAAADSSGRIPALGSSFTADSCTGETYILSEDGSEAYGADGVPAANGVVSAAVFDGCFLCADESSTGLKKGGVWVLRLPLPVKE